VPAIEWFLPSSVVPGPPVSPSGEGITVFSCPWPELLSAGPDVRPRGRSRKSYCAEAACAFVADETGLERIVRAGPRLRYWGPPIRPGAGDVLGGGAPLCWSRSPPCARPLVVVLSTMCTGWGRIVCFPGPVEHLGPTGLCGALRVYTPPSSFIS